MLRKVLTIVGSVTALACAPVSAAPSDLPHIVAQNGRHALIVDGKPFLMLGAQVNNSSNYAAALPKVWPTVDKLGANTIEVPVAWEQIEPVEGKFDFSFLDTLLKEARAHDKRLVILWFGTWKNTNANYTPAWVKLNPARFPRMTNLKGQMHYALTPFGANTLAADKNAFVHLMQHLKDADGQNTVLMVQVENESGSYGLARDHSPQADKLFAGPVPASLAAKIGKKGTWSQLFGRDAEVAFHAWYVASYIDQVAAAGKAIKPLPVYVNAALPSHTDVWQDPNTYSSGGPDPAVLNVWKVAAPHVDVLAPDIYNSDHHDYLGFLDQYGRSDNALFVPETGNKKEFARYFFPAVGRGTIGFSPFGMDETGYWNFPLGAAKLDDGTLDAFALNYRLFRQLVHVWPALALTGKTWGVAEPTDPAAKHEQVIELGKYKATVSFGRAQFAFKPPEGNDYPSGGAAIAQIGPDEFLVTALHARVQIELANPAPGEMLQIVRTEEGHYDADGTWVFDRMWNGDQTDYGLNFTSMPVLLHVKLATIR
jgi:beta-galactosidase GanA